MSEPIREVVVIRSYEDVAEAIEQAILHEGDSAPFDVDFSEADWAGVSIKYTGELFTASLPPSAMLGIIGLQATLYRSVAIILRDVPDIRKLTETEKTAYELTFTVGKGSSDAEGEAKGFLEKLGEAVATMDSKHKLIALLLLIPCYFGEEGVRHYIDEKSKTENRQELTQLSRDIMAHDERMEKAIRDGVAQSKPAAEVRDQSFDGIDSVVRSSGPATSIQVQKTKLNREHILEARRNPTQERKTFQMTQEFAILSVNAQSPNGFSVRLRSNVNGAEYWASLFDTLASDRDRAVIRKAEWQKSNIILTVTGRQIGNRVVDARIISAKKVNPAPMRFAPDVRYV